MTKNHDVLIRIVNELKIQRHDKESRGQYISRIVYSALSMWIRVSTLDEDILEQSLGKTGVSKIHITNACKPFLDNMIELYPEIYEWFYPEDSEENPIVIVRDRLYQGGELVNIGFNTDLALPPYQECIVNKEVAIIRGIDCHSFKPVTGLTQLTGVEEKTIIDNDKILEFYSFKNQSAEEKLKEYIKNCKWSKNEGISVQIFNKYSNDCFSSCWNSEYKLKNNDISLYRNDFFDFGLIKKLNDSIYTSQIEKYLIEQFEVRRFMYGLKKSVENSVVVGYKHYNEEKLVEINLYNGLPEKEQRILLLLGWPIKHINDKLNLLFHRSVWKFVEAILRNLNITLQEVK